MLEVLWFYVRVFSFVGFCALLLLLVSCSPSRAEPSFALYTACLSGNLSACALYSSPTPQPTLILPQTNLLTPPPSPSNPPLQPRVQCIQQGYYVICQ